MLEKIVSIIAAAIVAATPVSEPCACCKEPITGYDDMLTPSEVSVEELRAVLKYDLTDLAGEFIEAEEETGVNAIYLASIAALESGWGRYQFKRNNIFGFGEKRFDSEEECIKYVAHYLKDNYLNEDGVYYAGGYTLAHVNASWNGGRHWLLEITKIADNIIEQINEIRSNTQCTKLN